MYEISTTLGCVCGIFTLIFWGIAKRTRSNSASVATIFLAIATILCGLVSISSRQLKAVEVAREQISIEKDVEYNKVHLKPVGCAGGKGRYGTCDMWRGRVIYEKNGKMYEATIDFSLDGFTYITEPVEYDGVDFSDLTTTPETTEETEDTDVRPGVSVEGDITKRDIVRCGLAGCDD
ncbi:MAG: hypothetical protein ACOCXQ_01040 [Patescibacteria group bacterium]